MNFANRRGIAAILIACGISGCATTSVQEVYERGGTALPRPEVVLVYRFAISAEEVTQDQGFLTRTAAAVSSTPMDEQRAKLASQAADRLAKDLVAGINALGLSARLASDAPPANAVLISGAFIDLDQGNSVQRLVIGFGAGQSRIDTRIRVASWARGAEQILARFESHADSGAMPGAAVTMGAGAAAQGGVTAGMAAANVAVSGVKGYRSTLDPMLDRTADQALISLSHFFASQGWIAPDKVRTPAWSDL